MRCERSDSVAASSVHFGELVESLEITLQVVAEGVSIFWVPGETRATVPASIREELPAIHQELFASFLTRYMFGFQLRVRCLRTLVEFSKCLVCSFCWCSSLPTALLRRQLVTLRASPRARHPS